MRHATPVYHGVLKALRESEGKKVDEDEVVTAPFRAALPRAVRRAKTHCVLKAKNARTVIAYTAALRRCAAEHCAAGTDEDYDESKETAALAIACATYALRAGLDVARVADEYFAVAPRVAAAVEKSRASAAAKLEQPHTRTYVETSLNADGSTTTTRRSRVVQPGMHALDVERHKYLQNLPLRDRPMAAASCVAPGETRLENRTGSGARSGGHTIISTKDRIEERTDGMFSVFCWEVEPPVPEHERGGLFATREGAEAHRDDLRDRELLPPVKEQTDPVEGICESKGDWRFKVPGSSIVSGERFGDRKLRDLKIERNYKFGDVRDNAKNFRDKMLEWLHSETRATTPPPKPEDFGGVACLPRKKKWRHASAVPKKRKRRYK